MVHWELMEKKRRITYTILLFLPLALAVIWLIFIKVQVYMGVEGFLSPEKNKPILVALIIFTVGYLFFLGLLFSNNIREWYEDRKYRKEHQMS